MGYGIQNYGSSSSSSGLPWENQGTERRWDADPLEEEPKREKKRAFKKDLSWGDYALMGVVSVGVLAGLGVFGWIASVPPVPEDPDGPWWNKPWP
jgi:hypothetical protein